jgi:hypothetical protein
MLHGIAAIVGGFHSHALSVGIHLAHIVMHSYHRMIHGHQVMVMASGRRKVSSRRKVH